MKFLLLALLPALTVGLDFTTCDNIADLLCFEDGNCAISGFTDLPGSPVKCNSAATTPVVAPNMGCCVGGTADATTPATTVATTIAGSITTVSSTSCVDKLNPLTGVSDCPARSSLCTNSVYLDVMRDQCPKTCGFCTGTGTVTNSTITSCVDRVNPSTNISDCPTMKAYCNNTIYKPLKTIQCPATCGFCTSG
ncbi:hypothetical protein PRIPAC_80605 [Pristionchus pacificus]|uniref:ShK domain-containing protein n=1 Tax=Pristionchus pacificus TaxID=54126 RepID=A0A2A6C349_PRIPA|nr:hypothetical protein PRIPAC_80605 [Pristionchus pacificus]|eukprot:PDM72528.1 ShK domain-containing protein [Pristionchus pacificus]